MVLASRRSWLSGHFPGINKTMNNYGESGKDENAISQNLVKVISFIHMYDFRIVLE